MNESVPKHKGVINDDAEENSTIIENQKNGKGHGKRYEKQYLVLMVFKNRVNEEERDNNLVGDDSQLICRSLEVNYSS
jgi:hypothetical protein